MDDSSHDSLFKNLSNESGIMALGPSIVYNINSRMLLSVNTVNHKYLHILNRGECVKPISFPQNSNKILYCLTTDLWNSVKYEQVGVTPRSG